MCVSCTRSSFHLIRPYFSFLFNFVNCDVGPVRAPLSLTPALGLVPDADFKDEGAEVEVEVEAEAAWLSAVDVCCGCRMLTD